MTPTPTPPQAGGRKPQEQDAQAVIDAALAVDWGSLQYDGTEPVKAFIDLLSLYVTKWGKTSGRGGGGQPPTPRQDSRLEFQHWFSTDYSGGLPCGDRERFAARASWDHQQAKIDALAAADPARRQQTPQWVPVGERLPPDGVVCDWWYRAGNGRIAGGAIHRFEGEPPEVISARDGTFPLSAMSHWSSPLLPPPEEGDAPPRPPQGRQPQPSFQTAADIEAATPITVCVKPAPTPAPTLTAAEEKTLRFILSHLGGESRDVLQRIINRLLAAGAPADAGAQGPARHAPIDLQIDDAWVQRAVAADETSNGIFSVGGLAADLGLLREPFTPAQAQRELDAMDPAECPPLTAEEIERSVEAVMKMDAEQNDPPPYNSASPAWADPAEAPGADRPGGSGLENIAHLVPLECIECHKHGRMTTGPMVPVDAEHPGWLCPTCYARLSEEPTPSPRQPQGQGQGAKEADHEA